MKILLTSITSTDGGRPENARISAKMYTDEEGEFLLLKKALARSLSMTDRAEYRGNNLSILLGRVSVLLQVIKLLKESKVSVSCKFFSKDLPVSVVRCSSRTAGGRQSNGIFDTVSNTLVFLNEHEAKIVRDVLKLLSVFRGV